VGSEGTTDAAVFVVVGRGVGTSIRALLSCIGGGAYLSVAFPPKWLKSSF
jgi:hypothetical protein